MPSRADSSAGSIEPAPTMLVPRSVPSAGTRSSPTCDQVSSSTASPAFAPRSTAFQVRRWARRFSIIVSMSSSPTSEVWRTISSFSTSMSPKSGTSSKVAT